MSESDGKVDEGTPVPRVLVFFDYACQFCYLDWPRFKRLREEYEMELVLVPYELRPNMPDQGMPVTEVGGGHSPRVEEYMRKMAEEGDLDLRFPDFVPKTHLALALGEYARDQGPQVHEAVHEAIFEAYSARAADIGSTQVLASLAAEQGLDVTDVSAAFEDGRYDERLHQFHHLALALGVSATPAALICNELLIGSRPLRTLQQSLDRCLVTEAKLASEGSPPTLDR